MKLFTKLALIGIMCITTSVVPQRWQQQQWQPRTQQTEDRYCLTSDNYYGSCVKLSDCPQVAAAFQNSDPRRVQLYVLYAQRACDARNINGDPVICCTQPLNEPVTTSRSPRQTETPFFPPSQPPTNPNNPFLNPPTSAPVTVATPPPTSASTTQRTTTNGPSVENKGNFCRGPDLRDGTCKPIKNCKPLADELIAKQTDEVFFRFLRASNTICGSKNTNVCCPVTDEVPLRLPTVEEGCGVTNNNYRKIVGGQVSKKGAWPWVALISYDDEFKCGGTLVTARHVITAAHCILPNLDFVRLGEHDLTTDTETRHVDIKVVRMEKHPDYNKKNGHSDIGILFLERNVEFTDLIKPICMPNTPELRQRSFTKYTPFVVGWGKTMDGGTSSNVLQELQIPVYDNQVCRDRYQKQNRLFTENQFDKAVLCAGVLAGGKDTCKGDSGGPLMIPEPYGNSVRFYLIGVVAYGIGCARPEIPGVYSSTQYFMDWIIEKIASTNFV